MMGLHDVDEIVLYMPDDERASRLEEIIQAGAFQYHPPHHNILRYGGESL